MDSKRAARPPGGGGIYQTAHVAAGYLEVQNGQLDERFESEQHDALAARLRAHTNRARAAPQA